MRRLISLLVASAALCSTPAWAERPEVTTAMNVLVDATPTPETHGHGAFLVGVDVRNWTPHDLHFVGLYNTETLEVQLHRLPLAERVWLSLDAKGEAYFAGLFPDYFERGERVSVYGFPASYVGGGAALVMSPNPQHWIRARLGARRWFVAESEDPGTHVRPSDVTFIEPTLSYSFWRMHNGAEFNERHRMFPRIDGVALGADLDVYGRTNTDPWGVVAQEFARNQPQAWALAPTAWLRLGAWLADGMRWQVTFEGAYATDGVDDFTRRRIGGMNPYVLEIPGQPWGSFLSGRYIGGMWSWHLPVANRTELGLAMAGAYLDDLYRTGESEAGALFGVAGFADIRLNDWQLDARVGWSPTAMHPEDEVLQHGISVTLAAGVLFGQ